MEIHHYKVQNTGGCAHEHQGCMVLYAPHVKLFAHTHTQTLLLELLSFTDADNNTALHLSYFPRMIYTLLHYTYMDMFLNILVL